MSNQEHTIKCSLQKLKLFKRPNKARKLIRIKIIAILNLVRSSQTRPLSLFWSVWRLKRATSTRLCHFSNRTWVKCLMNTIGGDWRLNKFKLTMLAKNLLNTIPFWKKQFSFIMNDLKTRAMNFKKQSLSRLPKISKLELFKLVSWSNNKSMQARRSWLSNKQVSISSKTRFPTEMSLNLESINYLLCRNWCKIKIKSIQRDLCKQKCNSNNSRMEVWVMIFSDTLTNK